MRTLIILPTLISVGLSILAIGCYTNCDYEDAPAAGTGTDLSTFACNPAWPTCTTKHYCPTLDASLSDEAKQIASDAFMDWEISLGGAVAFDGIQPCTPFTIKMQSDDWFSEHRAAGARGYTSGGEIELNTERTCGTKIKNFVIRHETGHILGLEHTNDGNSIMYWAMQLYKPVYGVSTVDAIQYFTIVQCCPSATSQLSEKP